MCLQKYYAAAETLSDTVKKSGDLKVWITLNPNPENTTEVKIFFLFLKVQFYFILYFQI